MINKVFLTLIIFSLIPSVLLGPLNAQIQWDYPSSLRPDVEFWKSVFTVYSENQSILHDSENLNIIYKVITFDSSFNTYQRENYLEKIKDEIKDDLIRLAERIPDPDKRTHFEHYLIELFGPGSLPETFRQAARQIRSQQGMKERFAESLARSIPLLPYIREVFKKNNLPEELAYLPHIESSFNPLAKSRAGAAGMWQFMRSTARLYMKVNRIIDERYDPLISTQAAARLLKYNYEQLGEWGLAVTAYNFGLAGIKRAVSIHGSDYMRVRESFNHRKFKFASRNFYPEFLAVIEIMQDYRRYFPDIVPIESTVSMRYTLKNRIKFPALAKHLGISTKELQKLNPSYTSRAVNGRLYLPSGYWMNLPPGSDLVKLEMEMYNPDKEILAEPSEPLHRETFRITDSRITPSEHIPELSKTEFKAGNSYQKPGVMSEESIPRLSPENWNGLISFVESYPPEIMQEIERDIRGYLEISNNRVNVLANETLGHFADWLGIPLHYLQKLNNMGRRRTIYQGQRLRLDFSRVSPEEFSRKRHEYHLEILKSFMREKEFVNLAEYQINRGESVWELAKNRYQIPLEIIQYFNIRMDINRLYPGDVLRIPTFQSYNSLEETL